MRPLDDDDSINVPHVIVTINTALTESGCGDAICRDIISHLKDFGTQ